MERSVAEAAPAVVFPVAVWGGQGSRGAVPVTGDGRRELWGHPYGCRPGAHEAAGRVE